MKLSFATGNENKAKEAQEILGVEIELVSLPVDEIQSLDNSAIALKKAQEYYKQVQKPLFVDDNGLAFEALGGLPGPYISDFIDSLEVSGLLKLLSNESNRNAMATVAIAYIDGNGEGHTFVGEQKGTISLEERGENGFGWDTIFIPEGSTKTYAEMSAEEKNSQSSRRMALDLFKKFLDGSSRMTKV